MPRLGVEALEPRNLPAITAGLAGGVLSIVGDAARDNISVTLDPGANQLVVRNFLAEAGRFASPAVASIVIDAGAGDDAVRVAREVVQPATVVGGAGRDILQGGSGATALLGGPDNDKLVAGRGATVLDGDGGRDRLVRVKPVDTAVAGAEDFVTLFPPPIVIAPTAPAILTEADVQQLLRRAAAASASEDAIIAIVDRGGRLLGVRTEAGVAPEILTNNFNLVYAIDGAIAKARTGAFFGNNQAPLTSRTIENISQTTMTQREIESIPSIADPNSTLRGPGFVAPIGIRSHFPRNVPFTPQVDLFAIEHTNRDVSATSTTGERFDVNPAFIPASIPVDQRLQEPDSYGVISGLLPGARPRGIATLPGGIPIFKDGQVVGGIGVFFPGRTGFASEENSVLSVDHDPRERDRSFEAEYIAFAALGGAFDPNGVFGDFRIGALGGVGNVTGVSLPLGRIDLVGITLDIFGPGGRQGPQTLVNFGRALGQGNPDSGANRPVDAAGDLLRDSTPVPEGYLVLPHDGDGITAAEAQRIIEQGIAQSAETRAAIRLPLNSQTRMVFAVADRQGEIVALFREPDATIFSIDVAVAKARNVAYYANAGLLQPQDRLDNLPPGFALTNRSIRYLALPRYPEGIEGAPPGPFSILNDGGVDATTGLNIGPPLPASAYQSVQGFDAFNPGTNFRNPLNPSKQNGIVFFPGSSALFRGSRLLVGGFGVSGDGVDQDDVVTRAGQMGFEPDPFRRIDAVFIRGVRVPYQKGNRNPEGGLN